MTGIRSYFIDESGDGVLFDSRGRSQLSRSGCLQNFYLGLADVQDADALTTDLEQLRATLLADPYFRDVPSMQPGAGKTALFFHAKDDVPEVRREVFRLLLVHDIRFLAEVTSMAGVLSYVQQRNRHDASYRYHPNELYDHMTRRLLKTKLHKEDRYRVVFARRGSSGRAQALTNAIEAARARFCTEHGIASLAEIDVVSAAPALHGGLQAVDYFLWSLQRLFERGEDRYLAYIWPKVSLVHDVDDTRGKPYGVYYTRQKPPSAASIEGRLRI
ncbi:MAG: DUF3800 domain-containing protein [Gaiellales bacterium]|nr:DUF3800 domain-containing protein [Gaiellales bacterium]